jgi:hypothetical protein
MKDLTIIIPQASGAVPELWGSLGEARINVEAAISFAREHHRVVHVVVEDDVADQAKETLETNGYMVFDIRDVILVPVEDRPGALAEVTRTAENAGAEVYMLGVGTGNRVLLAAVNLDAARQAFGL